MKHCLLHVARKIDFSVPCLEHERSLNVGKRPLLLPSVQAFELEFLSAKFLGESIPCYLSEYGVAVEQIKERITSSRFLTDTNIN